MKLKDTVQYIMEHVRRGNTSMAALGFYTYLLAKPKDERTLPKWQLLEECHIVERTLFTYVRELRELGVLEVEYNQSKPTTYLPLELPAEALQKLHRKNDSPTTLYISTKYSNTVGTKGTLGTKGTRVEKGGSQKDGTIMGLVETINAILPRGHRHNGLLAQKYQSALLKLNERVDLVKYTTWFVEVKIEQCGKRFGWGLYLYPSMIDEYEMSSGSTGKGSVLASTSRWEGKSDAATTKAREKADKIKKLRGGK